MKKVIEFIDVKKSFSDRNIFPKPLSFNINNGDNFAVIGKSGVGKSTVLKMIMGFLYPDEGIINYLDATASPENILKFRNKCSWVPQSFNFLKSISVKQAIIAPFEYKLNIPIKPDDNLIIEYFDKVNLSKELLNNNIDELSGGERQRVCSVIALLLNRDIVILDEPTSNLDSEFSQDLMNLFFNTKKTLIISTHDKQISDKCNNILEL